MPTSTRRPPVPDTWLLPPAPRDPSLRARWDALPFEERRAIARRSTHPDAARGPHEELVAAVAERRIATTGRSLVASVAVGWLVLMTVWGFGRAGYPAVAGRFLAAGIVAGVVVAAFGVVGTRRRAERARAVVRALHADPGPAPDDRRR